MQQKAKIEIYTTPWCPFCIKAKHLLKQKGATYEEIDVNNNSNLRALMTKRAGGRHTVPQIFINDQSVGGCDELHALEREGRLDSLITESA